MIVEDYDYVVRNIPNWSDQLAQLVKTMWSGANGKCYFPYPPLATREHWGSEALSDWISGLVRPIFYIDDSTHVIRAYAAMVRKEGYWELGRFNSYSGNPRGIMLQMTTQLMHGINNGEGIVCEATQAHTSSQYIASQLGLRFAGYGFLAYMGEENVPWDILYFDNRVDLGDFVSTTPQLMNNLLGINRFANQDHQRRLLEASQIISTDKTSGFPPTKFHIYEKYLPHFRSILAMTIDPKA